jgi:hypothetical protein
MACFDFNLEIEKRSKIPFAVNHTKDEHVLVFNAIDNHVLTHGEASSTDAKIPIADASCTGKPGKKTKTVGNGVDQPSGHVHAAAILGDVDPNAAQVGFGSRRYTVGHYPA